MNGKYLPVRGHQNFDVSSRVEPIQLVHDFQHRPLNLVVAALAVVEARAADGVDLVEENEARFLWKRKGSVASREYGCKRVWANSALVLYAIGKTVGGIWESPNTNLFWSAPFGRAP